MGILGIKNRTENWKTAWYFAPFFRDDSARASLARRLGEHERTLTGDIQIELFWYGVRDYVYQTDNKTEPGPELVGKSYEKLFSNLRESVQHFRAQTFPYKFESLKLHNYDASEGNWGDIFRNIYNTEVDIVLKTPDHLLIGEAKDESSFGTDSDYALVHQLIRQYVMAKVLIDIIPESGAKRVIPFIVVHPDKLATAMNTVQVKFMLDQKWLNENNILSWEDIEKLAKSGSTID